MCNFGKFCFALYFIESFCFNVSYVDRADPDLPICLEQTVLVWIPLGFMWLCAPHHLISLCKRTTKKRMSKLYLCKQVMHTTKGLRRKGKHVDSATLFFFWLLLVVCDIFPFQTLIRAALREGKVSDVPRFCLFYISFGLELVALVLSAVADISPENPEKAATFLSRITFNWTSSLVVTGYKRPLVQEDMWDLKDIDTTDHISQVFSSNMKTELDAARVRYQKKLQKCASSKRDNAREGEFHNEMSNGLGKGVSQDVLMMEEKGKKEGGKKKKNKEQSEDYPNSWLVPTIYKTFKWILIESAFFKLVQDILTFVSPQILKLMIAFTEDKTSYAWVGYMYATLLLLVAVLQSLCLQQYFQRCFVLGMQVRTAIMAAVYKKALVVSNNTRKEWTVGETVNLISTDAQRFSDLTSFIHLLWSCPLQIIISIAFLWIELGPAALAGRTVVVLMVPINVLLADKARQYQMENMKFKDDRLKVMNEMLNGIKILKLYAWEPSFQAQAEDIREKELKVMTKFSYLSSVSTFLLTCVCLVSFAVFVGVSPDNMLTAEKAFTSISLFNILQFPLAMLPMIIASIVQTTVSKKRLEKFLSGEDIEAGAVQHNSSFKTAVSVCDGTFAWERDAEPLLKNVSLEIKPGQLVAVVGAVGSGKSSLISALLGEMHSTKGFINIQGSIAYVPQQAWIQNATLRDNVLFGSPNDERRFNEVIKACALEPDLELLPGGALTEIGEKGINLSGGQKQRVSLARAAYSQADIYLLDDPLSAVDAHVGKHLFENVIGPNGILQNKTRILVTHGVSFLPHVDEIVVLVEGVVSEIGSYSSLRASGGAFSEFLDTYAKEQRTRTRSESELLPDSEDTDLDAPLEDVVSSTLKRENSIRHSQRNSRFEYSQVVPCTKLSIRKIENDDDLKKVQKLIEKEAMETGWVKLSVFLQYLRAMGWGYTAVAALVYFIGNVAFVGQNLWLSEWTKDAVVYANETYPPSLRDLRVGVFGALGVAQGLFVFLGTLILVNASIAASRILHERLLKNMMRVPMIFFDTTPIGRVVNRFAEDIFTIDEAIPNSLRSWILCLLGVLGTLFVICLATPLFTIVLVPLAIIYYFVGRFYVATSRQLRRLDSVSRSPIYSHFGETVSGLTVIRAYNHQERFLKHNEITIDENVKSVYPWIVSNRWLAIRLEFLGNLVVFFACLFAVISRDSIDSGIVGLSISYALNIMQTLNLLVKMTSELETNIVAVKRVSEYIEIENEAEWVTDTRPPKDWPEAGRLQFENYKVHYRPGLDLVLHGITCDIGSTEKIGIVDRTGAGKSSLTNCLFRIIEAVEGRIFIDGIDIAKLGLHDLRANLTIIPQDPVLFCGTLRMNLDPFDKFSDEEIWKVLELSHLKDFAAGLKEGLQYEVSEGGENLSVGQRQLLCLARALLRKSRILILDEATAAVDLETDNLIQNTIREEFSSCTVLTIAHHLHSIMDSSRVMVLDAGRIVEFDTPQNLLSNKGHFYAMAKDAGITQQDSSTVL
uniref:ATP-binding cassette, sub-family C (CFTR/MRP), member 2 n=1 Tax=Salarias fasciatus TaxID=181472 RepID=A0A672IA04_SALFA